MKKVYVVLILIIMLTCSTTASSSNLTPEQWIYDAVEYLNGFEIKTADNQIRSLNRYQVALALANIIQSLDSISPPTVQRFGVSKDVYLEEMVHRYNQSVDDNQRLPDEYLNVLSKLAMEFHDELVILGYAVQDAKNYKTPAYNGNSTTILKNRRESHTTQSPPVYFKERYKDLIAMFGDKDSSKDTTLGSQISLTEDFVLGASLTLHETEEQLQVPGIAGLAGKYLISNDLILEGQYLHNLDTPLRNGLFQFGATVKLGDVELGGVLRSLQSRLENEELQSRSGYELSLRLGDLMLSTGRDPSTNSDLDQDKSLYTTSVDFKYGMPDSILLSAGYQVESELKAVHELGNPSITSLGLDIPIPQGKIKFGVTQEKLNGYLEESESSELIDPEEQSDTGGKQTALVGLSYALSNEADLKLHYYRLVNFDDMGSNSHDYTAEFSLRF